MNHVAAITPVSSHSPVATPVAAAAMAARAAVNVKDSTHANSGAKANGDVSVSAPKTAVQAVNQGAPEAVMLSVSPPPENHTLATIEYLDMRTQLATGDIAAAQQAYQRLQTALELFQPTGKSETQADKSFNAAA